MTYNLKSRFNNKKLKINTFINLVMSELDFVLEKTYPRDH